jgi:hypothetical protein
MQLFLKNNHTTHSLALVWKEQLHGYLITFSVNPAI